MSVPVHERSESNLGFMSNAESLQQLTNDIVMNDKQVPKKYRYTWTQEVFLRSMHIFENTRRANILYPDTQEVFDKRINYLMLAETDTEALLSQIAFARKNFSIPNGYLKDWEMLCIKTKNSIRYRIKEDRRKYLKNISEVNN